LHRRAQVALSVRAADESQGRRGLPQGEASAASGALRVRDRRLSVAGGAWVPGAMCSTNRIYVRVEAIRRLLGGDGPDRVARIGRLLAELPVHAEDKMVLVDGVARPVRQLGQPLNGCSICSAGVMCGWNRGWPGTGTRRSRCRRTCNSRSWGWSSGECRTKSPWAGAAGNAGRTRPGLKRVSAD
jgi:hypothetical protein